MTTHGSLGPFCPTQQPPEGTVWEYLQGRNNEDEIWLKDANFRIHCVGHRERRTEAKTDFT